MRKTSQVPARARPDPIDPVAARPGPQNEQGEWVRRLEFLWRESSAAVLIEDAQRRVAFTNEAFCRMFDLGEAPDFLVGHDAGELLGSMPMALDDSGGRWARIAEVAAAGQPLQGERIECADGRMLERDCVASEDPSGGVELAWILRDITDLERSRQSAQSGRLTAVCQPTAYYCRPYACACQPSSLPSRRLRRARRSVLRHRLWPHRLP